MARQLCDEIVECQQTQGVVIDWNETRIVENYVSLFVGVLDSKLHISPQNTVEIKLEDRDGLLLEMNGTKGIRSQAFEILKAKVSEKINQ